MPLLDGKVCVITGGAGSLGLASARLFLREGAKVMLVDLRRGRPRAGAQRARQPRNVDAVAADVSDAAATRAYVERTVAQFGKIDVLFSNAGNQGPIVPVTEYPEDAFDAQIAVHVRGAFLACKYGLPRMNDGGSIIITSSVVGAMGAPGRGRLRDRQARPGRPDAHGRQGGGAARRIRVNTLHPGADRQRLPGAHRGEHRQDGRRHRRHQDAQRCDPAAPACRSPTRSPARRSISPRDLSSFVTGSMLMADGGMRG